MKLTNHLKSLYRSSLKTALTMLLLTVAAFLFLYNLSECSIADQEYREARKKYEGVLTVEEQPVRAKGLMYNDFFLITDPTNPGRTFGEVAYEDYHHESLHDDTIRKLSELPYVSRVERRYMTAGVSEDYARLDTDQKLFYYAGRCILVATIDEVFEDTSEARGSKPSAGKYTYNPEVAIGGFQYIQLRDLELLAGREEWLQNGESTPVIKQWFYRDDVKDEFVMSGWVDYPDRRNALCVDNRLLMSDLEQLVPGRRYVFVLRNMRNNEDYLNEERQGNYKLFIMADDTLIDWWPYYTDVTDLPEGWLQTEEFAPLRELIQVTRDDLRTFDVVYGDDMASIQRVADGRMVCEEGRFLTPADAFQPVCVVNADFLKVYGLKLGDSITLKLGNYLCEQHASLGAVASTRGRYSAGFTEQSFTIIGSWSDLNEGNHADRDLYWCWSNNAIFVPAAFLPDCVNEETYTPKPAELSFVVSQPEQISAFVEESLPIVEDVGVNYHFSDGGWLLIANDLIQARSLAWVKLLVYIGATVFAVLLTVWLFIGRRKQEYGILRALGMSKREAGARLYIPFLILSAVSTVVGLAAARIVTARELMGDHAPAELSLFLLGALGFLILLAVIAFLSLLLIHRRSILELTQEQKS